MLLALGAGGTGLRAVAQARPDGLVYPWLAQPGSAATLTLERCQELADATPDKPAKGGRFGKKAAPAAKEEKADTPAKKKPVAKKAPAKKKPAAKTAAKPAAKKAPAKAK